MYTEPDWKGKSSNPDGKIIVGANTIIRELSIVNKPVYKETRLGDDCFIMSGCFIGHDTVLGDCVTMYPGAKVAGFVTIGDFSCVGMNASVHQDSKIGKCCFIGAGGFFKGVSPDGITWGGVPARPIKVNSIGIDRCTLSDEEKTEMRNSAELFIDNFKSSRNI